MVLGWGSLRRKPYPLGGSEGQRRGHIRHVGGGDGDRIGDAGGLSDIGQNFLQCIKVVEATDHAMRGVTF